MEASCPEVSPLRLSVVDASPTPRMPQDTSPARQALNGSPRTSLDTSPARQALNGSLSNPPVRLCIKSSPRSAMDAASRRQQLESALKDVTSQNISIRKAAIRYGLSKSSLCDFVRKNGITIPNRRGRRSVTPLPLPTVNGTPDDDDSSSKHSLSADESEGPSSKRLCPSSPSFVSERRGRGRRGRGTSANVRGALRAIAPKSILRESPWNSGGFPTQVAMSSWGAIPVFPNSNDDSIDASYRRSSNSPEHILLPPPSLPSALSPLSTGDEEIRVEEKIVKGEVQQLQTMASSDHAEGLMNFIDSSPSPYHAVHSVRRRLTGNGFSELREQDQWNIEPGKSYFVTKNQSTVLAFSVGGKWQPGNGFTMVGAHTDSPCLKVKPVSDRCASGYVQLGVELYGGGIWYTWFDRDLTVAGRVILRTSKGLQHRLVHIKRPIVRVPSLCIHLNRTVNDSFVVNKEQHMSPVLCTVETEKALGLRQDGNTASGTKHPPSMMQLLAKELNVSVSEIVDMELCLTDTQPTARIGIHSEFICGPRMDNLFNAFSATEALVASLGSLGDDPNIRVACLYDNEEVGSESAQGAASAFTEHVMRRLSASAENPSSFEIAVAKSYMLSADQGHAVHPNYEDKHERIHKPMFNKGMILKINANQRYASTGITTAIVKEVAKAADVPLQICASLNGCRHERRRACGMRREPSSYLRNLHLWSTGDHVGQTIAQWHRKICDIGVSGEEFVVRQDVACGSTIGPIQSARLGVATMDIGGPTLSMHSCREMVCAKSVDHAVRLYSAFYERFPALQEGFHVCHE